MNEFQPAEKIALLLNLLGKDVAAIACESLDESSASFVKRALDDFEDSPPDEEQTLTMLEDFEQFFNEALKDIDLDELESDESGEQSENEDLISTTEEPFQVYVEPVKTFPLPEFTGDVRVDLNKMHPYQVASALRNDEPKTIAVVMRNLATEHAVKTLELLPEAIRSDVFIELSIKSAFSQPVQLRILNAALEGAKKVEQRDESQDSTDQLVSLVRAMAKPIRGPMMEQLMEANEELGKSVKSEIYQFDDLLRLDNRDVQKVLGQSNTDDLVLALQQATEEMQDTILGNMSKRARQTIEDEMEFKSNVKEEEILEARKRVVEVIVRLIDSGEVSID